MLSDEAKRSNKLNSVAKYQSWTFKGIMHIRETYEVAENTHHRITVWLVSCSIRLDTPNTENM